MNDLDYILKLVKNRLGIENIDRDVELKQWIEGAIAYISSYTNRPIRSKDISEVKDGGSDDQIIKYPTEAITELAYREEYTRTAEVVPEGAIMIDYRSLFFIDGTTLGTKNMKLSYTTGRTLQDAEVNPGAGTLPENLYSVILNYVLAVNKIDEIGAIDGVKTEEISDYKITFKTSNEMGSGNILLSSSDEEILNTYSLFSIV